MIIETKIDYPTNQQNPVVENTAAYCFIGEIERDYMGDGNVVVGEPFTIAWDQITNHINTVPEMPKLLTIWLTPKNYAGVYTVLVQRKMEFGVN